MLIIDFIIILKFSIFVTFFNLLSLFVRGFRKSPVLYCGIVGFSGKSNFDIKKVETLGLINDMERGGDAIGIYTPNLGIKKDTKNALSFFLNKKNTFDEDNLLISHYRKKSVGANSIANAHPYKEFGLILCHNGTLTDYFRLSREYDIDVKAWETDSHLLACILGKTFIDGEYPDILKEYSGTAALLFGREDDNSLYMYRDYYRPLFYGFSPEGIYISSIKDSLSYIGCEDIEEVPTNTIIKLQEGKVVNKSNRPIKFLPSKSTNTNTNKGNQNFESFKDRILAGTRLALSSEIREDVVYTQGVSGYTFRFVNSSIKYTGISMQAIKPEMLVGFNLKYTSYNIKNKDYNKTNIASLTKDKYYKIVGVATDVENLMLIDDNGRIAKRSLMDFDYYNFIPNKGDLVKLTANISTTEEDQPAGNKDEIVIVNDYVFGDKKLEIHNPILDRNFNVPIGLIRTLTGNEYLEAETQLKNITEKTNAPNESNVEIIDEDDDNSYSGGDVITSDVLYTVLSDLCVYIEDLKENYIAKKDITKNISDIEDYILDSFDINNIVEKMESE